MEDFNINLFDSQLLEISNNTDIVKIYFDDVIRDKKYHLLDEIIHPQYIPYNSVHDPKTLHVDLMDKELLEIRGIDGIKTRISNFSKQFDNIYYEILDITENRNTVMAHYKLSMTHVGTWNQIPPTNYRVKSYGFHLFKFEGHKIISITGMMNIMDILTQLGGVIEHNTENIEDYLESIKRLLGIGSVDVIT